MFSTTIILFVTVSLSDSKSHFVIRLSIFVNPARSVSDSPDIFGKTKTLGRFRLCESCKKSLRTETSSSGNGIRSKHWLLCYVDAFAIFRRADNLRFCQHRNCHRKS